MPRTPHTRTAPHTWRSRRAYEGARTAGFDPYSKCVYRLTVWRERFVEMRVTLWVEPAAGARKPPGCWHRRPASLSCCHRSDADGACSVHCCGGGLHRP